MYVFPVYKYIYIVSFCDLNVLELADFHIWLLHDTYNPLRSEHKRECYYRTLPIANNQKITCDYGTAGR